MLFTLLVLLGSILMYFILKVYRDEDGKIPPFSNPDGRWARILGGAVLIELITSLIFDNGSGVVTQHENLIITVGAVVNAIILVFIALFRKR